ncbi:MAG: YebC/PmpR family DNA-binding transcriptional regulator [Planctomycetia bacterium]|jgi:YebC/PmpR family DNA-binding regulatory protein
MAGHSHWAGIKHKKALVDAKRGKLWSKLSKAIIVAARTGGGDVEMNLRLRYAIDDAKAVSMPKDNIQRAIKKGTGEIDGGNLEEIVYEGYGAAGVAVLCECLTDNRNRTAPEIRKAFELGNGKLGNTGCVAWMFDTKGLFLFDGSKVDEDSLMEVALEAGADDVASVSEGFEVTCDPSVFHDLDKAFNEAGLEPEMKKEMTRIPQNTVDITDVNDARRILKLMERLDDQDDVQSVSSNYNIPDEIMAQAEEE